MATYTLDFERPILEVEAKIQELRQFAQTERVDFSAEIARLERKVARLQQEVFATLTPWQRTQIARHPGRPYTMDYIRLMLTDFIELHGDRAFADDKAIVGGLARLEGMPLVVIGQQKGRDTKEKLARNFAMANPEGYRKALRLMKLAEKFGTCSSDISRRLRAMASACPRSSAPMPGYAPGVSTRVRTGLPNFSASFIRRRALR